MLDREVVSGKKRYTHRALVCPRFRGTIVVELEHYQRETGSKNSQSRWKLSSLFILLSLSYLENEDE